MTIKGNTGAEIAQRLGTGWDFKIVEKPGRVGDVSDVMWSFTKEHGGLQLQVIVPRANVVLRLLKPVETRIKIGGKVVSTQENIINRMFDRDRSIEEDILTAINSTYEDLQGWSNMFSVIKLHGPEHIEGGS